MKTPLRILYTALLAACFFPGARAQYHTEGIDPFSTRWNQYKTDHYRLLYPQDNVFDARQVSLIIDTSYQALHYGFSRLSKRIPIVLHTQNLRSNGIVTWTPKRAELITTPQTETFAVPWLKQLTVHEYRHVVQMNNLDRNWFRWLSYLAGEQAVGAATVFVPKWFLEGDAVLAETAMSSYGRALQPEFTLAYRTYMEDNHCRQFSLDKWFCGSYNDYIPNHYYLGYQITNASYKEFGLQFWDEVFEYVTRHPYFVFPRPIAFKKLYNTSAGQIFNRTFDDLKTKWDALPPVEENMRILPTPFRSYTIYSYPLLTPASQIIAHKYDFTHPGRLVQVDPSTAAEKVLTYTGTLSSRPALIGGQLFWTEYQTSTFWEQKNRSVVRHMPADGSSRAKTIPNSGNLFYITPYREGHFAAIDYDPVEKYSIIFLDPSFQLVRSMSLPKELTVHGMAWDEKTNTLALITLGENGMGLTGVLPGLEGLYAITEPSFVTINHLAAGDGKLFFNSIRSGRDESHFYDLVQRKEVRVSASKFGTVMPSVDPDSQTVVQATYRRGGYLLSVQKLSDAEGTEYTYSRLPENLLNPEVASLGVPNLDDMTLSAKAQAREIPSKRYRKGLNLLNLHSWAPVAFDAFETADDRNLDFNLGATIVSQNALSNTEAFLSYGYVDKHSWWRAKVRLLAMALKFEINAEYDGGNRSIIRPASEIPVPEGWADKKYFSIQGRVYLPIRLYSGNMSRQLTPSVSLTHYNTAIYRIEEQKFDAGYQKAEIGLSYAQNVQMAYRDLAPRWGFGLQAMLGTAPFNSDFGSLWSFYGNAYLPGVMANHSLRLRGAYQVQEKQVYHFGSNILFPRGVDYNFAPDKLGSVLADYRFPVAYPDGGFDEFLYFKRISANLFGGYARYKTVLNTGWREAHSYGAEMSIDFSPLRMVGTGFTFRAALYKASDKSGLSSSFGLSVDF